MHAMKRGRPPHPDVLTPAEWRVVHAVRHGMTNREIGRRLHVSLAAVKYHVTNAVGKLLLPSKAALRHWTGTPRASALHTGGTPMPARATLGAIGQVSRQVRDIRAAVAWYRDVLGLPHLYTFGDLAFFDCGGTRLFLTSRKEEGVPPGDSVLYFRTDDIEGAYRHLASRGVRFQGAPHMIHRHQSGMEEWMAFFEDPDGRPLALMSQVTP
jgi:catechol 2,3-dioxygenase-like lactoylglutathione lyase family enzyme/DNA-binding CsgD family transcriptional regulator